ncbi:hypothetical protein V4P56_03825 [Bartonella sp. B35(2025)]
MGFCWRRIILILFVFLMFATSLFVSRGGTFYQFVFDRAFSSRQINVTEEVFVDVTQGLLLEKLAVSFPDVIMKLSKMSSQQKREFIEVVRRDAIAVAFANGQSNERAQKFGEAVAMAISKAVYNPSIGDNYF